MHELWNIINVNIGAVTMMTKLFIEEMKKRGQGAIVNVSSGSELQPLPLMTAYAASKVIYSEDNIIVCVYFLLFCCFFVQAYVKSFTEALRYEYSGAGLTIQHLSPMFINTKMNDFSGRLRTTSLFVPDAPTYAKYAINTLGKVDHSTGYWAHGLQVCHTHIFFYKSNLAQRQLIRYVNGSCSILP